MRNIIFYILWFVAIFFALYLASIALSYFAFDLNYGFLKAKQHLIHNKLWLVFFFVHLFFGAMATLTGWPLFFSKIIPFKSVWHKRVGKFYIYSILLFTGPTGLYLAFFAEGGKWATLGFILMSFAWMLPTYMALYTIVKKDLVGHYRWIIRSYCMTLSGVTLRLFMPFGARFVQLEEETTFIISSYIFVLNIILGEIILLFNKQQQDNLVNLID
ncbi:MAG: DUF2306 domain-containing protein [Saprospiraceae bacterium]|nr:DUF2306 domain-containing protein [Saprospiraceae bacterium]